MRKLEGRVALVTGSGKNIGRCIALALAELGANVAVHGRADREAVDVTVKDVEAHETRAYPVMGDISDQKQVSRIVMEVQDNLGPIDILVCCVAVRPRALFLDLTVEQWEEVMRINLDSAFYLCKAVLPGMVATGRGSIIGLAGGRAYGAPDRAHVATSRAGLVGLMKSLALEFAPKNIRANIVMPGTIDTERPHLAEWYPSSDAPERNTSHIPMGRWGRPQEVAAACAFLATDEAGFITGQVLPVNGGSRT